MTHDTLKTIYTAMTPDQKSAFNVIQHAVAAGLLTSAERRATIALAKTDRPKWETLVNDLRLRLAQARHARLMVKAKLLLM